METLVHNLSAACTLNVFHSDMQWDLYLLLWSFSKAVESLAQGGEAEIQRVKEEAQKSMQEMEKILTSRINLLEEVSG